MADHDRNRRIANDSLRYLDDAYNLARWLMRNDADAQDAVQEAYLRVIRFAGGFRGEDPRAWLLKIVRNVCYSQLRCGRRDTGQPFDETRDLPPELTWPEAASISACEAETVRRALETLPLEFREALVMREMHELSYREIAQAVGVPIGTVMSRLARARARLRQLLRRGMAEETGNELQPSATLVRRLR